MQKECEYCGFLFKKKSKKKFYCSRDCYNKSRKEGLHSSPPNLKFVKSNDFTKIGHAESYILGLLWADGHISDNSVILYQEKDCEQILVDISMFLFGRNVVTTSKKGLSQLSIHSSVIVANIISLGGIVKGKKSYSIDFPNIDKEYIDTFLCGYFDGDGCIRYKENSISISFSSKSKLFLSKIIEHYSLLEENINDSITIHGFKALDICGRMYEKSIFKHLPKYEKYMSLLNWQPRKRYKKHGKMFYRKLKKEAVAPEKKRVTDSGYDICAIEMKQISDDIWFADTHLSVVPEHGWYYDCIARSSLPKKGWQFLGGVGVIDRSYNGSIGLYLKKLDNKPLPDMPFKCAQLIPRPIVHFEIEEIFKPSESDRGVGGFGSTDIVDMGTSND